MCSNSDVHERHSITSTQSASQAQRKRKLLPSSPHPKFLQYITFPRWGEVLSVVRVLHPAAPAVFSLLPCEKRQTNHAAIRLDPSTHSFVPGQKFFRSFSVGSFRPYHPLSFLTLAPLPSTTSSLAYDIASNPLILPRQGGARGQGCTRVMAL